MEKTKDRSAKSYFRRLAEISLTEVEMITRSGEIIPKRKIKSIKDIRGENQ